MMECCIAVGDLVSFHPVVYYNDVYLSLVGLVSFITQLQMLHLLRYNKTIALLGATMSHALTELLVFGLVIFILLIAFTSSMFLLYHQILDYSSIEDSMGTLVSVKTDRQLSGRRSSFAVFVEHVFKPFVSCRNNANVVWINNP